MDIKPLCGCLSAGWSSYRSVLITQIVARKRLSIGIELVFCCCLMSMDLLDRRFEEEEE